MSTSASTQRTDRGPTHSRLALACVAVLSAGVALPLAADTDLPACKADVGPRNSKVKIDNVTLEKTTIDEIFKTFGKARETYSKVEECCMARDVCYLSPDQRLAVEFGGWKRLNITSYNVTNDADEIKTYKNCVVSPRLARPIENSIGLTLGMSKSEVVKRLGTPKRKFSTRDDEIEYYFQCHPANLGEGWARITYILIRFKDDKATLIRLSQDTQG